MFHRYLLNLIPFYDAPEEDGAGGGGDLDLKQLGDIDDEDGSDDEDGKDDDDGPEVDDDGERKKPSKKKKVEEKDDEEEEEEENNEEENEDDEEETDDKTSSTDTPTYKAVKDKYPNFFKEFPALKSAFFLAPKFLEIFSDPEAAQEASTKAEEFDKLEGAIVGEGDATPLLETLSENNPKALNKFVENFGPKLRSINQDAYLKLTGPIIEELLYYATQSGTKRGDKNLILASRHLANFAFNNGGEIVDISKKQPSDEKHPAEKQLEDERTARLKEKFNEAIAELGTIARPEIDKLITEGLSSLTPFERKAVIREVWGEMDSKLSDDTAFQSLMRGHWKRARESNFSKESKTKIRRAWLERARQIAPVIRNRLKKEALEARKGDKKDDDNEPKDKKRTFDGTGANVKGKKQSGFSDPKKIDWQKTSDADILNS